jgi:hypothetical protein
MFTLRRQFTGPLLSHKVLITTSIQGVLQKKRHLGKSRLKKMSLNIVISSPDQTLKIMTAKFSNGAEILEVTKSGDNIELFIYQFGEEQVGQSVQLTPSDISDLIKYLESLQLVEQ